MKQILRRLFLPPGWAVAALAVFHALALTFALNSETHTSPLACAVYVACAYATVVIGIRVSTAALHTKSWLYHHKRIGKYIAQPDARAETSLHASLLLNIVFALYYLANALLTPSPWFTSAAAYYALLAAMRYLLIRDSARMLNARLAWRRYILCGWALLILTLALAAICVYTIRTGHRPTYPGHLIYAVALYTFSHIALAALNLKRYPSRENPIYAASKAVSFAAALVSVFFLQTALISSFGYNKAFFFAMSVSTGGNINFIIALMAIRMIALGTRELKACSVELPVG